MSTVFLAKKNLIVRNFRNFSRHSNAHFPVKDSLSFDSSRERPTNKIQSSRRVFYSQLFFLQPSKKILTIRNLQRKPPKKKFCDIQTKCSQKLSSYFVRQSLYQKLYSFEVRLDWNFEIKCLFNESSKSEKSRSTAKIDNLDFQ